MNKLIKIKNYVVAHPYISQLLACVLSGFIVAILFAVYNTIREIAVYKQSVVEALVTFLYSIFFMTIVVSVLVYPIVVTIYEVIYFFSVVLKGNISKSRLAMAYDLFVIFVGVLLEFIILELIHEVCFEAEWYEELYNNQLHTPLSMNYILTFGVLFSMFAVGMVVLMLTSEKRRPPLVTVLSLSLMYIGLIEAVLFTVHIIGMNYKGVNGAVNYKFTPDLMFTFLIPVNMILILLRVLFIEIKIYKVDENRMSKIDNVPFLGWCNKVLTDSKNWPVVALVIMIPVLGIIIAILTLFGQAPDAAIKAFTETANYTFSTKIPPQNVFHDEHYLCTVAAGGHEKVVKPIRMGKRHGHDVVVNRQLLIANAFEQVLEEKTPFFHKKVRTFYDTYGFPIAKLIRSKLIADTIWILMKPLEWIFLIVIYLVDINPEDRIASQYM